MRTPASLELLYVEKELQVINFKVKSGQVLEAVWLALFITLMREWTVPVMVLQAKIQSKPNIGFTEAGIVDAIEDGALEPPPKAQTMMIN